MLDRQNETIFDCIWFAFCVSHIKFDHLCLYFFDECTELMWICATPLMIWCLTPVFIRLIGLYFRGLKPIPVQEALPVDQEQPRAQPFSAFNANPAFTAFLF